jgi:hypothetical protein
VTGSVILAAAGHLVNGCFRLIFWYSAVAVAFLDVLSGTSLLGASCSRPVVELFV